MPLGKITQCSNIVLFYFCPQKRKNMTNEYLLKPETIAFAERALYRTNLLIEQCGSWLSEEEGRKNMEKMILEKLKKGKKKKEKSHKKLFICR